MARSSVLQASIKQGSKSLTVALAGPLNEDAEGTLKRILKDLPQATQIDVNCGAFSEINSIGFRAFRDFVKAVAARGEYQLHDCPFLLMEYFSLLPREYFSDRVISLSLPYKCSSCAHEGSPIVAATEIYLRKGAPPLACPVCEGAFRATVDPAEYLAVLNDDPTPP